MRSYSTINWRRSIPFQSVLFLICQMCIFALKFSFDVSNYFSLLLIVAAYIKLYFCFVLFYCVIIINGYPTHGVINLVEVYETIFSFGQLDESCVLTHDFFFISFFSFNMDLECVLRLIVKKMAGNYTGYKVKLPLLIFILCFCYNFF